MNRRTLRIATVVAVAMATALPFSSAPASAATKVSTVRDSDHDGMPDKWEQANGLNLRKNDAKGDKDRDGLTNLAELKAGTKPSAADTDKDGMPDGWEIRHRLNPVRDDAAADADDDGLCNRDEFGAGDDPRNADSDHDGVRDGDSHGRHGADDGDDNGSDGHHGNDDSPTEEHGRAG